MTVLDSFTQGAESSSDNRVVVRNAISLTFDLPEYYGQRLATLDHVSAFTPLDWFGGIYIDQRPENFFAQFGCDPYTLFRVFPEITLAPSQRQAFEKERGSFIAGRELAEQYGWKPGDTVVIRGEIYPFDLNITLRGIFENAVDPTQERQIYFHREYMEEALDNPGVVGTWWLKIDSPGHVPEVIAAAEAMFANSASQVKAETEKAFQLSFVEMLGNIRLLFGAIGLAVVISVLFITGNTMAMTARERTTEMAVLRTLGFGRRHVVGLVFLEALAIALLGGVIGLLFSAGFIRTAALVMGKAFPLFSSLRLQPDTTVLGVLMVVGIGLASGIPPGLLAARTRIVDGLRRVG
jgi:putative ABC transport system permease protein